MITLFLSLALSSPADSGVANPRQSPSEVLHELGVDAEEFKAWAHDLTQGRLYELNRDTVVYNRNRNLDFILSEVGVPGDFFTPSNPKDLYWDYFQARMKDHWEGANYGDGSFYGTGIYAHVDPFGADGYGPHIMAITLPRGSRILMDDSRWNSMDLGGCTARGLPSYIKGHNKCRVLFKALLRSLRVVGIGFTYGDPALTCAEKTAVMMVDDAIIEPKHVGGHYKDTRPQEFLRPWFARSSSALFKPITLGCGAKRVLVEPDPDLDYPHSLHPLEPCKHQGPSPLNRDLLGTLSSMVELLW